MNRRLALVFLALSMGGCATYTPSVPENYAGPKAQLADSAKVYSSSKADFFVAEQIDGASVDNSLNETFRRNQGRGMSMTPYYIDRPLIAERPIKILVKARTHYAAPIQALSSTVFQVKGEVEFTPKANGKYVVKGELGSNYSAVWIEDVETSVTVGQKVEAKGSAELGFLEK